jgi:16S rRNA (cytosine967-C5)-methyltransferase
MSGTKTGARLRAEAAKVVDAVVNDGQSLDRALAQSEENLSPADRPMIRMLCYGCLRHYWTLRWQLGQLLDKPLKARDSIIETLLMIGFFQLSDTRVPDHAAVSATVEAARRLKRPKLAGLINAVLRNYLRQKIGERDPQGDEARFNHPEWLIERFRTDWPDHWREIIDANNDRAPMWLRVGPRYEGAADYLAKHDIGGSCSRRVADAYWTRVPRPAEKPGTCWNFSVPMPI